MALSVTSGKILALDVGSVRIGLALADVRVRLPVPAGAVVHDEKVVEAIREFCKREEVAQLVIGLPRNMQGQDTAQTEAVRSFGAALQVELPLPVSWQDEAVTSVRAEEELRARGKPYAKEDIDALAATYILEDYLHEHV